MRILIVDDDKGLTQLLQLVFESKGFGVTVAYNGEQALSTLSTELPEAILLDIMMPGMSGVEVCAKVRADPRTVHTPIIVLTAKSDPETRHEAMAAGATEYLVKPVRPSDLINRIREVAAQPDLSATKVLT
jgi:DNA-binding response OmpR family regulator